MTTYTKAIATSQTLGAATEDIVNLTGCGRVISVFNRGASTDFISVKIGPTSGAGTAAGPTAVTALGDGCFVLQGGNGAGSRLDLIAPSIDGKVTVRLISAGTPPYTVQALPLLES